MAKEQETPPDLPKLRASAPRQGGPIASSGAAPATGEEIVPPPGDKSDKDGPLIRPRSGESPAVVSTGRHAASGPSIASAERAGGETGTGGAHRPESVGAGSSGGKAPAELGSGAVQRESTLGGAATGTAVPESGAQPGDKDAAAGGDTLGVEASGKATTSTAEKSAATPGTEATAARADSKAGGPTVAGAGNKIGDTTAARTGYKTGDAGAGNKPGDALASGTAGDAVAAGIGDKTGDAADAQAGGAMGAGAGAQTGGKAGDAAGAGVGVNASGKAGDAVGAGVGAKGGDTAAAGGADGKAPAGGKAGDTAAGGPGRKARWWSWPLRAGAGGGRRVVAWAKRPSGRVILPGAVAVVLVAAAGTAGVYLVPQALEAAPAPSATPEFPLDAVPGAVPSGGGGLASNPAAPGGSAGVPTLGGGTATAPLPGAVTGARPADQLQGWAQETGTKVGIPVVAVQAYAYAEWVVGRTIPSCHLSWTTLAAIGKVESSHGSANGAVLNVDGTVQPAIYGLPLDGKGGRQLIRDTDQGTMDQDPTYDRAVGPMQFIPATWQSYKVDADNDGVANPNDIDDASLAAATYLCQGGRDMAKLEAWWDAILSYNAVRPYAQKVFDTANDYGRRSRA